MKKIFLAAPYTHYFDRVHIDNLRKHLANLGFEVLVPHDFVADDLDGVEESVRLDFAMLDSADIILADVTRPSHGVGMEILHARRAGKQVILLIKSGTRLSGMVRAHAHDIIEYDDFSDLAVALKGRLER